MARTFTETRDPRYLDHFQPIIDIRDGLTTRPVACRAVDWDLITADGVAPQDSLLANTRRNLAEAEQLRAEARSALKTSKSRCRNTAEVDADWIREFDNTGRFSYQSPGVLPLLQYSPQELIRSN